MRHKDSNELTRTDFSSASLGTNISKFNAKHLKNSKNAVQYRGKTPENLLALHAELEKHKNFLSIGEKHAAAKKLQGEIEEQLKFSPDQHLQAIKNSRSKILRYFKSAQPGKTWFDTNMSEGTNTAFSSHQNIETLKAAKDTLHFWDFAAVEAIKERIKRLEPKKQETKATVGLPLQRELGPSPYIR